MEDVVRVQTPWKTRELEMGGNIYKAKNGEARVVGDDASALRKIEDILPEHIHSLSQSGADEYWCKGCRRYKLSLFGSKCGTCGRERDGE